MLKLFGTRCIKSNYSEKQMARHLFMPGSGPRYRHFEMSGTDPDKNRLDSQQYLEICMMLFQSTSMLYSVLRSRSRSREEPHLLAGAGAVTRCSSSSDGSGSDNGIKHG
jgi:hypothetical protein